MKHGQEIGTGNTATIYQWEEGKVLKLFHQGYPCRAVEREFRNAKAIGHLQFQKPNAYEVVRYQGRLGIVYDRIEGELLLDWFMRTADIRGCAVHMARLHRAIIQNPIDNVTDYREVLRHDIADAASISQERRDQALKFLDRLKDGGTLCHGDFHPGNIFISGEKTTVIDFMNVCRGHYLYDVARAVFLVECGAVPEGVEAESPVVHSRKALADLYLREMKVTRDMIGDYLFVIAAARIGECAPIT